MVHGRLLVLTLGLLLAGVGLPAHAQALEPTTLTIDSVRQYADLDTPIGVTLLVGDEQAPVAGAQVLLERRVDGSWNEAGLLVTDETGRAEVPQTLARDAPTTPSVRRTPGTSPTSRPGPAPISPPSSAATAW